MEIQRPAALAVSFLDVTGLPTQVQTVLNQTAAFSLAGPRNVSI
jgi:hypothetical protein